MVWHSHHFNNFSQFVSNHTIKGICLVNEEEVGGFLELSCLFYYPVDAGNLIYGLSDFSKYSLNLSKFLVHVLWEPSLDNFKH